MSPGQRLAGRVCPVCKCHQSCAEILGLVIGLHRWCEATGEVPPGLGGTIGLANQHAQIALQYCDAALREPYGTAASGPVVACQLALRQFVAISNRRCGPDQVMRLVPLAFEAQAQSWDAAAVVYRR